MSNRYISRREAAERLRDLGLPLSVTTLASMVSRGDGPPHYRFGSRAVYSERDLIAWAEARLRPAGRTAARAAATASE